ncbi:hypothetical protein, conserved [Babesia bigemina]|uniref:Uncharacterized protein n=1 Tax=Babesia bigemina TaxID=5866 RepID=A0A061CZD1_BABBI|nr:hypothetical protein, conserved [Babesia bigemina]CDR93981.1 hypothetical protein, conserved [Babesia bigemina]|eukprot:XP_012766167.1 hypothetical protein, conserved [Babesia bigemina]
MEPPASPRKGQKAHTGVDRPLVIEELETPHDRASVINGAVKYLAGSGSARYPLGYSNQTTDEFFPCEEDGVEGDGYHRESYFEATLPEPEDSSDADSDIHYVKQICRQGLPAGGTGLKESSSYHTPSVVTCSRYSESSSSITHLDSGNFAPLVNTCRRPSVTLETTKGALNCGNQPCHTVLLESTIPNMAYHSIDGDFFDERAGLSSNAFHLPKAVDSILEGADMCNRRNLAGVMHGSSRRQSFQEMCAPPKVGSNPVASLPSDLMSFAKDFRARYGAAAPTGALDSSKSGNNVRNAGAKRGENVGSLPCAGSAAAHLDQRSLATPSRRTGMGGLSMGYMPTDTASFYDNAKCGEYGANRASFGSVTGANQGAALQMPFVRRPDLKIRQLGHNQSCDILLRDYKSPISRESVAADGVGASPCRPKEGYAREAHDRQVNGGKIGVMSENKFVLPYEDPAQRSVSARDSAPNRGIQGILQHNVKSPLRGTLHSSDYSREKSRNRTQTTAASRHEEPYSSLAANAAKARLDIDSAGVERPPADNAFSLADVNRQIDEFFVSRMNPTAPAKETAITSPPGRHGYTAHHPASSPHPGNGSLDMYDSSVIAGSTAMPYSYASKLSTSENAAHGRVTVTDAVVQPDVGNINTALVTPPSERSVSVATPNPASMEHVYYSRAEFTKNAVSQPTSRDAKWVPDSLPSTSDPRGIPTAGVDIGDVLLGQDAVDYQVLPTTARNASDIKLYDSARLDLPEAPCVDTVAVKVPLSVGKNHADGREVTPLHVGEVETALECTPADNEFDENVPTRTNHVEVNSTGELTRMATLMSFGDELGSYVPGDRLAPEISNAAVEGGIFASGILDHRAPKDSLDLRAPKTGFIFNKENLNASYGLSNSSVGVGFMKGGEHAPRNRGSLRSSYADSLDAIFDHDSLCNSQQDHKNLTGRIAANPMVERVHNVAAHPVVREAYRSSLDGRPQSSLCARCGHNTTDRETAYRDEPSHSKHGKSKLSDAHRCRRSSMASVTVPASANVCTGRGNFEDDRSVASSDYVQVPLDEENDAAASYGQNTYFCGSDDTLKPPAAESTVQDKALMTSIENILSRHVESAGSLEHFSALIKQLHEAIEGKNVKDKDSKQPPQPEVEKCITTANRPSGDNEVKQLHFSVGQQTSAEQSQNDGVRTERKAGTKFCATAGTQTYDFDFNEGPVGVSKGCNSVYFKVDSSDDAVRYNTNRKERHVSDVATNTPKWPSWYKDSKHTHAAVRAASDEPSPPLTREALIKRMTDASEELPRVNRASGNRRSFPLADYESDDDTRTGRKGGPSVTAARTTSLPNGLTEEELLDVYNEVMKLTRILHVKDVKSLTRAVTARMHRS